MEKFLAKYFWVLNVATLALVAWLLAGGVGQLAAAALSELLPGVEDASLPKIAVPRTPAPGRLPDGTPILERNIFDSMIGPILPAEDPDDDDDDGDTADLEPEDLPMVPCPAGKYELLAAVASSRPEWSFASVSVDKQTRLCRVGHSIGDREVAGISWRYLFLKGPADMCYVDMFATPEKEKPRTSSVKLAKADIKNGIRVDGPNERTVDRALVDAALANPAQFARSVRVRPYKKNGKVTGFRLRRVKKGSPFEALGAGRGDIIHAVNGVPLTSVDQALAAYQSLRTESRLQFDITRKGKPETLTINIR
ncbi:MAG TPA: type II secretion system protein GspC [Polyangia bacterium]|nr:type II secretion system protein GspC [Polyangia bacterium]